MKFNMDYVVHMRRHEAVLVARKRCRRKWYQMEFKYNTRYEQFYPVQRRPWPNKTKHARIGGTTYTAFRVVMIMRRFRGANNTIHDRSKMARKWDATFAMRGLVGWRDVAKRRKAE